MALIAACEPRPPQPIRATLTASLAWAWTAGSAPKLAAMEPAAAMAEERLRKSRREGDWSRDMVGSETVQVGQVQSTEYLVLSTEYGQVRVETNPQPSPSLALRACVARPFRTPRLRFGLVWRDRSVVNPAEGGPVIEDPGVRPGVVGGVRGGEDADDEQRDRESTPPARVAEPIGGGEECQEPQRREPDQPAQAAGAAAVIAIDLRTGEVEGEDDGCD